MTDQTSLPTFPPPAFPIWPLIVTTAMQTLATMAVFAIPALAPAIGRDLGVDGVFAGYFISLVYGAGIVSSLMAATAIHRFGAVRVCQAILAAAAAMLLISTSASLFAFAFGAVVLGCTYGATAPVSTHLLAPRTPPQIINLVLSIRQIGVPMGGVFAALLMPPLALRVGWQSALLSLAMAIIALLLILEAPRRRWDAQAGVAPLARSGSGRAVIEMLRTNVELRRLSLASVAFSGLQLCFIAFLTVQLTSRAGFGLVAAGQALALYQLSGLACRPLWGWLADASGGARRLIVLQGLIMGTTACLAGHISSQWPVPLVYLCCAVAGATANSFTGLAYAEFARIGGVHRTEATGLGSASMFSGVLLIPSAAASLVTLSGSYVLAFTVLGVTAMAAAGMLALKAPEHASR